MKTTGPKVHLIGTGKLTMCGSWMARPRILVEGFNTDQKVTCRRCIRKHHETKCQDHVVLPAEPTLAMLEAGWGICGTDLSSMEPDPKKILLASDAYSKLIKAAPVQSIGLIRVL